MSSIVENTVSVATSALRPDPPDPPDTNSANNGPDKVTKFPIETYAGLDAATAERIKKFEAETKAMLTRPVAGAGVISRSTQRLSEEHFQETSSNPWGRLHTNELDGVANLKERPPSDGVMLPLII